MNILFLSLLDFNTFDERNIYSDLLREFIKNGHDVYCISPVEKCCGKETTVLTFGNSRILKLKIGNTQKVSAIEKGVSTLRIENLFIKGIKEYFADVKFDFILYATPPVTFAKTIRFVKKRDKAKSYLMLKDIFPQNAVDIGMMSKSGFKGIMYRYFREKEKELYALSDRIGCMSQSNVDYLLKNNPEIPSDKVEICPNCIDIQDICLSDRERVEMRRKYGIPLGKKVFVYGGNLGKPQGIPFIVDCLKACAKFENAFFIIAGSGTERHILEEYIEEDNPDHVKLFGHIPKDEYDKMIACCDFGLIFLDHRFTIPNFPSRLLSYLQAGLPVIASTDKNTDIGKVIVDGGFGWWCESRNSDDFAEIVSKALTNESTDMSEKSWQWLNKHYRSSIVYATLEHFFTESKRIFKTDKRG